MAGIKQAWRLAHQPVQGCLIETFWREKMFSGAFAITFPGIYLSLPSVEHNPTRK